MLFCNNLELSKDDIHLRPLTETYFSQLTELASEQKIWEFHPEHYSDPIIFKEKWLNKALRQIDKQERFCFVIFYQNQLVGSSSYYDIDELNKTLNIGYTWYPTSFWGSKINPTTKLLMLSYAFEYLEFHRVGFCVDATNKRSCHALEKLGIKKEGILRNHLVLPDGRVRNSVIMSVIQEEWLDVKQIIEGIINHAR